MPLLNYFRYQKNWSILVDKTYYSFDNNNYSLILSLMQNVINETGPLLNQ